MDVSDGLAGDLEKICSSSGTDAIINAESVPVRPELNRVFGEDARAMALSGGEDYELVFTASFDVMDRLLAKNRGTFTHIGRIVEAADNAPGRQRVGLQNSDGSEFKLVHRGWDHLDRG
jgi:thiamine-monophosphate kinase